MKRLIKAISALLILTMVIASVSAAAASASDTFTDNANGTVTITYTTQKEDTILILCENTTTGTEAVRYTYKLDAGKNSVSVPLTEGAGTYKLRLCKARSDGKAVVLETKLIELSEDDAELAFEVANMIVNYKLSNDAIKKAKTLTKGAKTDTAKIKKIWTYIYKNYAYDYDLLKQKTSTKYYVPDITETYSRKVGICYDISCMFAGMLRSVGVEARVVTGYTPNVTSYHAWTQVYDSNKEEWYTIDATYDMCMYIKGKTVKMIKKDSDYNDIIYTY